MQKKWLYILLTFTIGISTMACLSSSITSDATEDSAAEPKQQVLLEEDFSKDNTGWDIYEDETISMAYENDMYVVVDQDPQFYAYGYANKNFADTSIEVESTLLSGPMDVESGIICRSSYDNFYFGIVSIDGYYGIVKAIGDDFSLIQMDSMPANSAINQGNEMNKIRFDCIGNSLSLYVNGELLTSVTDDELTDGDIGFIVGTYDEGGAKFGFDNLVVTKP
ncbi:MAG: hypothetical protein JEZ00_05585 [Anaerolineaceae bacterium]|nr:hypothetical protein [Anaerolineaceae bacterium]